MQMHQDKYFPINSGLNLILKKKKLNNYLLFLHNMINKNKQKII